MSVQSEASSAGCPPGALPDQPASAAPGRTAAWRAEPLVAWPRHTRVFSACLVIALAWLASEALWPLPSMPPLAGAGVRRAQSEAAPPEIVPVSAPSFERAFAARTLFVPEVPVESHDLSRQAVDEQLRHMRLTAILREEGQLVAWVEVPASAKSDAGSVRSPFGTAQGATQMLRVKKGDFLGDFRVEDVTSSGVDLKIAGFSARLTY